MKRARDYMKHELGPEDSERRSFCVVPVLGFLEGRHWDDRALALVQTLRPSTIRVSGVEEKANAVPWRVTVRLTSSGEIRTIVQEVPIDLPEQWKNGEDAGKYIRASQR